MAIRWSQWQRKQVVCPCILMLCQTEGLYVPSSAVLRSLLTLCGVGGVSATRCTSPQFFGHEFVLQFLWRWAWSCAGAVLPWLELLKKPNTAFLLNRLLQRSIAEKPLFLKIPNSSSESGLTEICVVECHVICGYSHFVTKSNSPHLFFFILFFFFPLEVRAVRPGLGESARPPLEGGRRTVPSQPSVAFFPALSPPPFLCNNCCKLNSYFSSSGFKASKMYVSPLPLMLISC